MMDIPFLSFTHSNSNLKAEMMQAFESVFDSEWYILGEKVSGFEQQYAEFNNVKHCVGISNGLDAIFLSLKALDVKEGDEVIVPSNTYIATVLAVTRAGATPVFAEPDMATYNITADEIAKVITAKTKVIIPVHLYGQSCEMEAIMNLAREHNCYVLEDNAQSQGATYNNKLTGSWGQLNATSFYPGKNLGAFGDAGAVTTNEDELAGKVRVLRNYGSEKKYYNDVIGYNMRLDELQASLLSVKLKHLDEFTNQRVNIASSYNDALTGIDDLILPKVHEKATHVYHLYVVRTKRRDELQGFLKEKGIGTLIHYPVPPHLQKAYANLGYKQGDFPIAEEIARTCLSLPVWPGMTGDQIAYIAEQIRAFYK